MSAFLQQLPALEQFLREGTHDPAVCRTLLEGQRTARVGYCTAVREDLALPPGHGARRPLPPVSDTP
ncbi:hypothetical protein [Streptomyces coelicoflavus]|uniref:hypothetical protein n=1 Tax=Streptomyces coelicoflavus TaxID=285562 RepID=UPI002E257002